MTTAKIVLLCVAVASWRFRTQIWLIEHKMSVQLWVYLGTAIVNIAALVVAACGARATQAVLRSGNARDLVIDFLAFFDRHLLRSPDPAYRNQPKSS
jgi:hypothetical protein